MQSPEEPIRLRGYLMKGFRSHPPWLLALTLICGAVYADNNRVQVLSVDEHHKQVDVSYDPKMRWAPNDGLCIFDSNRSSICGTVTVATKDTLKIEINDGEVRFQRGAWVVLRKLSRPLASLNSSELLEQSEERKTHDVALGVATGFNYFFPTLQLQQALNKDFSIGIMPLYVNYSTDGSSVTAFGGFATASYYYTHFPFRGFYGQIGAGFYSINATVGSSSESHGQPAFLGTLNWRGRASWELGLDIGVSLGLQYVVPVARTLTNDFSGVLPLLMVSLGLPF
jgi:hypothetical protein